MEKTAASLPGISFVFPCLNEEASVAACVREALDSAKALNIPAEVTVVDNGSSDNSVTLARDAGAHVILYPEKGYGAALLTGMEQAKYSYIITGDTDGQHKFTPANVKAIYDYLQNGADFVNGNRFHAQNADYDLPFTRQVGNTVFSRIFNMLYGTKLSDVTCGMSGYTKAFFSRLPCTSRGMELNIEIRALNALFGASIREANLECVNRLNGESHVRLLQDGFSHIWTMFAVKARHKRTCG